MYNFNAEEKGMMKIIFNHYSMLSDNKEITKWTGDFTKRMGAVAFLKMTMEMMKTT